MTTITKKSSRKDSRFSTRFQVKKDVLVYNQTTFAEIINISEAGLSCKYLINLKDAENAVTSVDLLNSPDKLHVRNILCEEVHYRDKFVSLTFPSTVLRTCGVKFISLNDSQQKQVEIFIDKSKIETN